MEKMGVSPELFTNITNSKTWFLEEDFKKYIKSQVNLWLGTRQIPMWKGYLITVNPPDKFTNYSLKEPKHIHKAIAAILSWSKFRWVDKLYLSVEQRSSQENHYKGLHFHVVVVLSQNKRISHVRSQISKNLSSKKNNPLFMFDFLNNNNLNIRSLKKKKDLDQVQKYINGVKQSELKCEKSVNDRLMRREFGLEPIYSTAPETNIATTIVDT